MSKAPNLAPPYVVCWRCRQDVPNGSYSWVRVSEEYEAPLCRRVCEPPRSRLVAGAATRRRLRRQRLHAPILDVRLPEVKYDTKKPPPYADVLLEAADQVLKHVVWDKHNPHSHHPRWGRIPTAILMQLAGAHFTAKQWLETHPAARRAIEAQPPYLEDSTA